MTIAELIEKLMDFPGDIEVTAVSYDVSDWEVEDVRVIDGKVQLS